METTTTPLPRIPILPPRDEDEELDRFLLTLLGPDPLPRTEPAPTAQAPYPHTLSLVLPAHNEEDNLQAVTWTALETLPGLFRDCEIIIVDDGSTDATPRIVDRLAEEDDRVRVIHHPQNRGYGAALRSGFAAARGDRIMFMDADRQFDIRDVTRLAPYLDEHDVVAGYRLRRRDPLPRVILGASFNTLVKALFGVWVRDIDCGFKVFRADLLRSLDLQAPGALINTEILALARRRGATIVEVGVRHHPRGGGAQSGGSPRVVLRALGETVTLWWRLRKTRQPVSENLVAAPTARSR
jgi:hypothetical protein